MAGVETPGSVTGSLGSLIASGPSLISPAFVDSPIAIQARGACPVSGRRRWPACLKRKTTITETIGYPQARSLIAASNSSGCGTVSIAFRGAHAEISAGVGWFMHAGTASHGWPVNSGRGGGGAADEVSGETSRTVDGSSRSDPWLGSGGTSRRRDRRRSHRGNRAQGDRLHRGARRG